MKVLFISRATLYSGFGGDSVQIFGTAKYLKTIGVNVDIKLCNEEIDYSAYDLIHFFNIIRPADILIHAMQCNKPYVVSTIFLDYTAFEKEQRGGMLKWLKFFFSKDSIEYLKVIGRWIKNGEKINSTSYLWLGHKRSMNKIAKGATLLLPNSVSEYRRLESYLGSPFPYTPIPNGIDLKQYDKFESDVQKEKDLVICVARIEGNKNQLNLIRALNNTEFRLKLIGKAAPNHQAYLSKCKEEAAPNIEFVGFLELEELTQEYKKANVHILPSFCETTGLSSLEAAFHHCNLVITKGGDTKEYFQEEVIYCDPSDPSSILESVRKASNSAPSEKLYELVKTTYTWKNAARETLQSYRKVLDSASSESGINQGPVKESV